MAALIVKLSFLLPSLGYAAAPMSSEELARHATDAYNSLRTVERLTAVIGTHAKGDDQKFLSSLKGPLPKATYSDGKIYLEGISGGILLLDSNKIAVGSKTITWDQKRGIREMTLSIERLLEPKSSRMMRAIVPEARAALPQLGALGVYAAGALLLGGSCYINEAWVQSRRGAGRMCAVYAGTWPISLPLTILWDTIVSSTAGTSFAVPSKMTCKKDGSVEFFWPPNKEVTMSMDKDKNLVVTPPATGNISAVHRTAFQVVSAVCPEAESVVKKLASVQENQPAEAAGKDPKTAR